MNSNIQYTLTKFNNTSPLYDGRVLFCIFASCVLFSSQSHKQNRLNKNQTMQNKTKLQNKTAERMSTNTQIKCIPTSQWPGL